METYDELLRMYEEYKETVKNLVANAKPFAGFFGFGSGPKNDPCHQRFYEQVNAFMEKAAESAAPEDEKELMACASYILGAQADAKNEGMIYWTMMAVHGAVRPLIPLMLPQDAEELALLYEKRLPRRERMPLQDEVLKKLQTRGKE